MQNEVYIRVNLLLLMLLVASLQFIFTGFMHCISSTTDDTLVFAKLLYCLKKITSRNYMLSYTLIRHMIWDSLVNCIGEVCVQNIHGNHLTLCLFA